jgi:hypothetical protein
MVLSFEKDAASTLICPVSDKRSRTADIFVVSVALGRTQWAVCIKKERKIERRHKCDMLVARLESQQHHLFLEPFLEI